MQISQQFNLVIVIHFLCPVTVGLRQKGIISCIFIHDLFTRSDCDTNQHSISIYVILPNLCFVFVVFMLQGKKKAFVFLLTVVFGFGDCCEVCFSMYFTEFIGCGFFSRQGCDDDSHPPHRFSNGKPFMLVSLVTPGTLPTK